jgi:uncharacterized membrane protein HdeD (DUF308 family)
MIPQVSRGWSIFLGLLTILLGLVALSNQFVATITVATFIGIILLFGAAVSIVKIFSIHGWQNHIWYLVVALAYGVAGFVFIARPFEAAIAFTFVLGWAILIGGIFRIFMAFRLRHHRGAGWVLFSAIVSIILGGLIISQWPVTGLYILGLFLGIELIFAGIGWLGLGLSTAKK